MDDATMTSSIEGSVEVQTCSWCRDAKQSDWPEIIMLLKPNEHIMCSNSGTDEALGFINPLKFVALTASSGVGACSLELHAVDGPQAAIRSISIFSSAKTVEVYALGQYLGTHKGQQLLENSPQVS